MKPSLVLLADRNHRLFPTIDQTRALGHYVIVDPMDTDQILYLTERQYLNFVKIAISNETEISVIWRPQDVYQEVPPESSNSPKGGGRGGSQAGITPPNEGIGSSYRETKTSFFSRWLYPIKTDGSSPMLVLGPGNLSSLIKTWGIILNVRLGASLTDLSSRSALLSLAHHFKKIASKQSITTAILRMKVGVYCVNSYLAGSPVSDTRHLGTPVSLSHGLPAYLPLSFRMKIRNGNLRTIRLITSLLTSYKVIKGVYKKPTLSTIENSPINLSQSFVGFLPKFSDWINSYYSKRFKRSVRFPAFESTYHTSVKAGPNFRIGILGAPLDAEAWLSAPRNYFLEYCKATGIKQLETIFHQTVHVFSILGLPSETLVVGSGQKTRPIKELFLGKLSLKEEAAGKVRVFAIVDWFTQSALTPLHKWMFDILRVLPSDGTFDQESAVETFVRDHRNTVISSFDLSAATDNIPVRMTTIILSYFISPKVANLWEKLMVDRDFLVPQGTAYPNRTIRYGRGQPMGALSSWASLAITHHFLVQLAADRVQLFPTLSYRVLGDDIVIAGKLLADSYESVCQEFEIPINSKGIISDASKAPYGAIVNFANQVVIGLNNISPISLREELQINTLSGRCEAIFRLLRRGFFDIDSQILSTVLRLSTTKLPVLKQMLGLITLGEIPDAMRALIATLLLPRKDGNPFGDQEGLLKTSFAYFYISSKEIYNHVLSGISPAVEMSSDVYSLSERLLTFSNLFIDLRKQYREIFGKSMDLGVRKVTTYPDPQGPPVETFTPMAPTFTDKDEPFLTEPLISIYVESQSDAPILNRYMLPIIAASCHKKAYHNPNIDRQHREIKEILTVLDGIMDDLKRGHLPDVHMLMQTYLDLYLRFQDMIDYSKFWNYTDQVTEIFLQADKERQAFHTIFKPYKQLDDALIKTYSFVTPFKKSLSQTAPRQGGGPSDQKPE